MNHAILQLQQNKCVLLFGGKSVLTNSEVFKRRSKAKEEIKICTKRVNVAI